MSNITFLFYFFDVASPTTPPTTPPVTPPITSEEVCGSSHETYVINGSSVLGKYSRAAVAVDNVECSKIGRQILEQNGRTMDAAIAAAVCNGVMNTQSMGIGGGCVITVYSK